MLDFVDGELVCPNENGKGEVGDMEAWIRADSLVQGWILVSLSESVGIKVVNRLISIYKNSGFTAKGCMG